MIQYCVLEWPKKKLREDGLRWPKHGSTAPLLCKALYLYLHYKGPKKVEQLEYARIWLKYWEKNETISQHILALRDKSKVDKNENPKEGTVKTKTKQQKPWDPLSVLPPASTAQPHIDSESEDEGPSASPQPFHQSQQVTASPCGLPTPPPYQNSPTQNSNVASPEGWKNK